MVVGTSVTKGTFPGIKVSCSCSSLEESFLTAPWTKEQLVRPYMPSNAGLSYQKSNKPPSSQAEVPGGERADPRKQALRLGFDSSSTTRRQLSAKLNPGQSCCHMWRSPSLISQWSWVCSYSMQHHTECPYKPSIVKLPPDSLLCGYSRADCTIIPSL